MNTSGFYMSDGTDIYYGPNFVYGPGFELHYDQKDTYSYPANGWSWFESEEQARAAYGLDPSA